ncbi:hypothetical protein BJ508DRAFT_313005 [Ascobolus immersus RN42]|uniref:Uncharacterized protein n=1 Tax=Ascobolus immersus RN42 TaxID=1160509 RepID=A0A3N4HKB8_ASCIM|nr:hypothetical protein BJ508DRAFT_313005 [Ascobolus immersus RN42]
MPIRGRRPTMAQRDGMTERTQTDNTGMRERGRRPTIARYEGGDQTDMPLVGRRGSSRQCRWYEGGDRTDNAAGTREETKPTMPPIRGRRPKFETDKAAGTREKIEGRTPLVRGRRPVTREETKPTMPPVREKGRRRQGTSEEPAAPEQARSPTTAHCE